MKPISVFFPIVIGMLLFMSSAMADIGPPREGGVLPEILLSVPEDIAHREYLGLKMTGTFTIPQIKASVVVIEIFSMYCPHCQRETPVINKFYSKIESDDQLRGNVKIIGIGVGNSEFEVDFFRKKYAIPFPLFSDGDFSIHKKIGEVRTPYFIGVQLGDDGKHRVFYSQLGGPKDSTRFLENLLKKSGLK
ncbi:MAG: TlpA family protein disulfide reductase [Desulfobacterales bacterium]|nr:TlpA family protein disulfide reductase [Desulfobacterales bacterium]